VDHAAEYLRLSVTDARAGAAACELLVSLGYGVQPVAHERGVDRWYDARSVGELSRVEAGVIADRVVPSVASASSFSDEMVRRLRAAVVDTLHECFLKASLTSGPSGAAFRGECVHRVRLECESIAGAEVAREIGRRLEADMLEVHRAR
jgi:hypothetical protein